VVLKNNKKYYTGSFVRAILRLSASSGKGKLGELNLATVHGDEIEFSEGFMFFYVGMILFCFIFQAKAQNV
jgi:hypothetical protein